MGRGADLDDQCHDFENIGFTAVPLYSSLSLNSLPEVSDSPKGKRRWDDLKLESDDDQWGDKDSQQWGDRREAGKRKWGGRSLLEWDNAFKYKK